MRCMLLSSTVDRPFQNLSGGLHYSSIPLTRSASPGAQRKKLKAGRFRPPGCPSNDLLKAAKYGHFHRLPNMVIGA